MLILVLWRDCCKLIYQCNVSQSFTNLLIFCPKRRLAVGHVKLQSLYNAKIARWTSFFLILPSPQRKESHTWKINELSFKQTKLVYSMQKHLMLVVTGVNISLCWKYCSTWLHACLWDWKHCTWFLLKGVLVGEWT